jgi:hypothetical protein
MVPGPQMKRSLPARGRRRALRAFTLAEVMVALGVFVLGLGIVYESFMASVYLTNKNISLNIGNLDLQRSYYSMLTNLESAGIFVDCANYSQSTNSFTAVATGTWGNAVRFMTVVPISLYILPDDNSGYTVSNPPPPTRNVKLQSTDTSISCNYNTTLYPHPAVTTSLRFYPCFAKVTETIAGGSSPGINVPGLGFSSYTNSTPGLLTLHMLNPVGTNSISDCNRAYLMVESAYAVTTDPSDGHKQLLYFADATNAASYTIVARNLDPLKQTQANDTTIPAGGTPGTFCMTSGLNAIQALLPIRSKDYTNFLQKSGGTSALNNTWLNVNLKFRLRRSL